MTETVTVPAAVEKIDIKPVLYAALAIMLCPLAGIAAGAALGSAVTAFFGLNAWYMAGAGLVGAVLGYFPGQFAGVWTARYQLQKIVVQLASTAAETAFTRLAKFLAKKTKVSVANPTAVDAVKAVTENLVKDKPKSIFGLAKAFGKSAIGVFRRRKKKPSPPPEKKSPDNT